MFGGRIAEELIFGKDKVTTGASNDIAVATSIARRMVTEWGMSETLGPVAYEEPESEVFLGRSVARRKNIADKTAELVDKQIRKIIDEAYERTKEILTKNKKELDALAKALQEYETLTGEEISLVLQGKKLQPVKTQADIFVRPSVPTVNDDENVVSIESIRKKAIEKAPLKRARSRIFDHKKKDE